MVGSPPFMRGFSMREELLRLSCTIISLLAMVAIVLPFCASSVLAADIEDQTYITWSQDHVKMLDAEKAIQITLDSASGSGFASNQKFLYGSISMEIKLMAGDSAGTVTAYYLSSEINDEFDFEFLGNVSGQPYLLQTNVYSNGTSGREHRVNLWFDPAADYHTYSFLWNKYHTVFFADSIPIRIFANNQALGVPYISRPMRVYASLWNGEYWATRFGQDKINWTHAPFVASFRNFTVDACIWQGQDSECSASTSSNLWWEKTGYQALSSEQASMFETVQNEYTVYDYCKDVKRYPIQPAECSHEV
ncbi:hypothetical protein O6H91_16G037700 [Diphasiastrum complanatum]|uniref:Uncharacterized protein n=1 Tax=Diphasiastrum complanatum TaxID=34168 RepID=A0ACC2BBF5_DIPCM|nr:hypothetical protein O6H91_Y512100 [Diphasiastrum complanatum]KAJ7527114.1 hypothetical protein O6H91_16G037700 [Diphasiastrum complanatum]